MKNPAKIILHRAITLTGLFSLLAGLGPAANAQSYYEKGLPQLFSPAPNDTGRSANKAWRIRYFGPVGIGIDLVRPGMTMQIWNIEAGSPADKTGKLEKGQIIESINGVVLKDVDPRIILGEIITRAEATDGKINLKIKGQGNVLVQIPVMGSYSPTWPVNCPKSDKIVRNLADLLAREDKPSWGSVLFLLSTGEDKDLAVVRRWMQNIEGVGGITWEIGYKGIGICEYYLRTGDEAVLPAIRSSLDDLKERMYNGGWSGRGPPAAFTYSTGNGQLHASGVHAMTFILMARICGVEVDEYMFQESFKQFYRFAGHGNVAYGNGEPEGGFRDNGKHGGLAVAMAAAAMLSDEGEASIYAQARDTAAMKSFYATNWFHAAHTGGGMGEIWHHAAVSLMHEKRPIPYRSYLDTRRWVMDSSRRHDGSIAIEGMDDRYNRSVTDAAGQRAWGTYFALTYTYPRQQLQLWGAPRSKWAKTAPLPQPWGNATDRIFQSPEPVYIGESVKLTMEELLKEQVPTHSSKPVTEWMKNPDTTEKEIFRYLLHPEHGLRVAAIRALIRRDKTHFVTPLLKSGDPRLRQAGLLAITGMFKGNALPKDALTPEMFDLVGRMVDDPNESWWVKRYAIQALARADTGRIARHRASLLQLLDHESVWIQTQAVLTLANIATEREYYQEVLPRIIDATASFKIDASSYTTSLVLSQLMKEARPEVKNYAAPFLKKAFAAIPNQLTDPGTGAVMKKGAATIRWRMSSIVLEAPDGEAFVKRVPKTTLASHKSGKPSDMFVYDGTFTPNDAVIGKWTWAVYPGPNHPGEIDERITTWLEGRLKNPPLLRQPYKDSFTIKEDGEVSWSKFYRGNYFWTGDWLVGISDGQAVKMEVRSYQGYDFLIIERGNFEGSDEQDDGQAGVPDDYHCGYHVYLRDPDL